MDMYIPKQHRGDLEGLDIIYQDRGGEIWHTRESALRTISLVYYVIRTAIGLNARQI
jgi:hypothetical protein